MARLALPGQAFTEMLLIMMIVIYCWRNRIMDTAVSRIPGLRLKSKIQLLPGADSLASAQWT